MAPEHANGINGKVSKKKIGAANSTSKKKAKNHSQKCQGKAAKLNTIDESKYHMIETGEVPCYALHPTDNIFDSRKAGEQIFEWIISPMSVNDFFQEVFEKKPLLIHRNSGVQRKNYNKLF